MANLTREQILARKLGNDVVTLPDGSTVAIRAVSHKLVLESQKIDDPNERTAFLIAHSMTDPVLSYEDVLSWSESGDAGDIVTLTERVQELSRLTEGAGKSRVPRARKRS